MRSVQPFHGRRSASTTRAALDAISFPRGIPRERLNRSGFTRVLHAAAERLMEFYLEHMHSMGKSEKED